MSFVANWRASTYRGTNMKDPAITYAVSLRRNLHSLQNWSN
jgi:hypothetical protein